MILVNTAPSHFAAWNQTLNSHDVAGPAEVKGGLCPQIGCHFASRRPPSLQALWCGEGFVNFSGRTTDRDGTLIASHIVRVGGLKHRFCSKIRSVAANIFAVGVGSGQSWGKREQEEIGLRLRLRQKPRVRGREGLDED